MNIELKDGIVSTNSEGVYWKLLTPGYYLVKAVVFSKDGKDITRNDLVENRLFSVLKFFERIYNLK